MNIKLMNANFEESLNLLDDNFVQFMNKDVNKLPDPVGRQKVKAQIVGVLLIVFLLIINFLISLLATKASQGKLGYSAFPKPSINFLPLWLFYLLLIVWIVLVVFFRDRGELYLSRVRGQFNLNTYMIWLMIEFNLLFLTLAFSTLTIIGASILFIGVTVVGYTIVKTKKRSLEALLFNTKIQSNKLDSFIQKTLKLIFKYGGIVIMLVLLWKFIFPTTTGVRTDIVGFIGVIAMWVMIDIAFIAAEVYLFLPYLLSGYYKNKYPEEYREWEGKTQLEWYGEKYFNKHIKETEKEEKI